jgi:hypothetical protein
MVDECIRELHLVAGTLRLAPARGWPAQDTDPKLLP